MINWKFFPLSDRPPELVNEIAIVFENASETINSNVYDRQESNAVLAKVRDGLVELGFQVESGKKANEKIKVPVLFGLKGTHEKTFEADAYHEKEGYVIEVEAGRGVVNNQFLKDLFQACMMNEVYYLVIAVRNNYRGSNDFGKVNTFFETLYASQRLKLPLKGIMIIGY